MPGATGFSRILFAVNQSQHSAAAVPVVAGIAAASHANVRVLHLWSPDDAGIGWYGEINSVKESEALINGVVEKLRAAGVSAIGESSAAMPDEVAAFIDARADSIDADLIVLGNRGLSELHSFLIGSQTQRVLANAGRPVLAVRNTKRRAAPAIRRVVVAIDCAADCDSTLQVCIDAARPTSAVVEVVDIGHASDRQLRAISDRFADQHQVATWRSTLSGGRVPDQIIDAVTRAKADLLVIEATPPRARSLLVGDVMQRVLQSCPCPVLVAPQPRSARGRCTGLEAAKSGACPADEPRDRPIG